MKLSAAFSLLQDIYLAFATAFLPTLQAVWLSPSLLFHPRELSRTFMSYVWILFGDGVDMNARPVKEGLIRPNARGVVFDIGAGLAYFTRFMDFYELISLDYIGHGHTIDYLNRKKVTKYIALEPNTRMHPRIRERANAAGYTEENGTLLLLPYGAEELEAIAQRVDLNSINTMIDILSLCSLPPQPEPRTVISNLVKGLLAPGGTFIFYEHVLSPRADVAWWQRFWTPIWSGVLDGCRLDRPTHIWIEEMGPGVWREGKVWGKKDEPEEHLFWHRTGKFIRR
jgi:hypothetical protein